MTSPTSAEYTRGALYGLAAAGIWAGWIVVARLGLRTGLTPWDIAALRFGVGGLLLLPYLRQKGLAIERLGWVGLAAVVLGCGAPMVLLVNAGLLFAPAAHACGLFSGMVPLMVALLAAPILHEAFTSAKSVGITLILLGVIGIVWSADGTIGTRQNIGHVLFVGGAFSWACYTVAMRRARLDGLHAAAIAAVGNLVLYLPVYALVAGSSLLKRCASMRIDQPENSPPDHRDPYRLASCSISACYGTARHTSWLVQQIDGSCLRLNPSHQPVHSPPLSSQEQAGISLGGAP